MREMHISHPVLVRQTQSEQESVRYINGRLYAFHVMRGIRMPGFRFPPRITVERQNARGQWKLVRVFQ